jgi:AcrR family transcriptional regulator
MAAHSSSRRHRLSPPPSAPREVAGACKTEPGTPSLSRSALLTRQKLLVAATEEFAENGFSGARTARIAHRARINRAMLHYHFGSKHALFEQVVRLAAAEIIRDANWNVDDPIGSLLGCVSAVMRDPKRMRLLHWGSLQGAATGVDLAPIGTEPFESLAGVFLHDAQGRHKAWIVVCAAFAAFAFPRLTEIAVGTSVDDLGFGVVHRRLVERVTGCLKSKR